MPDSFRASAEAIAQSIKNVLRTRPGTDRTKLIEIAQQVLDEYVQQGNISADEHARLRSMLVGNPSLPCL